MRRALFVLGGAVLALAAVPLVAQSAAAPPGDAGKGKQAFLETGCYACHGTVGHGGAWQGPKLAPQPLAYPLFLRQLRTPARSMPRYGAEVLSDAEVVDIYAYLKSIGPSKTPEQTGLLAH